MHTLDRTGTRLRSPALILISMLGFAVFFWGLQYKLSLYYAQGSVPAAKLLSQRERPASCVTVESLLLAGQPLSGIPHKTLSSAYTALLADVPLEVAHQSQALIGASFLPRPPQPWQIAPSSSRAPPVTA